MPKLFFLRVRESRQLIQCCSHVILCRHIVLRDLSWSGTCYHKRHFRTNANGASPLRDCGAFYHEIATFTAAFEAFCFLSCFPFLHLLQMCHNARMHPSHPLLVVQVSAKKINKSKSHLILNSLRSRWVNTMLLQRRYKAWKKVEAPQTRQHRKRRKQSLMYRGPITSCFSALLSRSVLFLHFPYILSQSAK